MPPACRAQALRVFPRGTGVRRVRIRGGHPERNDGDCLIFYTREEPGGVALRPSPARFSSISKKSRSFFQLASKNWHGSSQHDLDGQRKPLLAATRAQFTSLAVVQFHASQEEVGDTGKDES